jgi:starch synthase
MELLFSTLEFAPYVRKTAAAEAVASLARALQSLGHQVTVAVPGGPAFEESGLMLARRLSALECGDGRSAGVADVTLPSGVRLCVLDVGPGLEGVYGRSEPLDAAAATALGSFAAAVAALAAERAAASSPFDVLHGHDFGGGLALLALAERGVGGLGTVLTVHDARRTGLASLEHARALGVPAELTSVQSFGLGEGLCLLKGLLGLAGRVATPSECYARQLCSPEQHGALSRAFAAAGPSGVLEGVDLAVYNPATDAALPTRFDAAAPEAKGNARTAVLRALGLDTPTSRPVVLVETAPNGAPAITTLLGALPALARLQVQLIVAGFGAAPADAAEVLDALAPLVHWIPEVDPAERRRLLAAADFALCIDRHAPTARALAQAARYGTIPIAYATDAVPDRVVDADASLETGTGFLFDAMTQRALTGAVARAVAAYSRPGLGALRRRVMRRDYAWDGPARRYVQLYERTLGAGVRG